MNSLSTDMDPVTLGDTLDTWNRERSNEELRSFIATRHASLPDDIELF
jgi:hypothetical protein